MGDYYSSVTKNHYSTKEQMEAMEKAYFAELQEKQNKLLKQQANDTAKANELMEQRMAEERENAEKIARATIQAEQNRYENELILEAIRTQNEENERKIRLCDNVGADYNELIRFDRYIADADNLDKINKLEEEIKELENNLQDFCSKEPTEKSVYLEYESKINVEIEELQERRQLNKNYLRAGFILFNFLAIPIIFILVIVAGFTILNDVHIFSSGLEQLFYLTVIGTVIANAIYIPLKRMSAKSFLTPILQNIKKLEEDREIAVNNFKQNKEKILTTYNEIINDKKQKLKEMQEHKKECEDKQYNNFANRYEEFLAFRIIKYNLEMEMLLMKLNLPYLSISDAKRRERKGAIENEVQGYGTVNDYIFYIKTKLGEIEN